MITALNAQPVALVVDDAIDVKAAGQFIEMLLTYDEDVVIDSGAASFLPLSSYLIDTEIAGLLDAAGRELVIHTIVTGGGSFMDTARGLEAVVEDFPATATLIAAPANPAPVPMASPAAALALGGRVPSHAPPVDMPLLR